MTRGEFVRKWLGNPNRPYVAEMRDEMWDDLERVILKTNLAYKKIISKNILENTTSLEKYE